MSTVVEAISELLNFPETIERFANSDSRHNDTNRRTTASVPTDILDTPKEYLFFFDLPGLSKSDIQVAVEDENTLVITSNGKRKREEGEEGCKYIRLERRTPVKVTRKFRLPENCNFSKITAKCENGVLGVAVEKLPPPPAKTKTVEVAIS